MRQTIFIVLAAFLLIGLVESMSTIKKTKFEKKKVIGTGHINLPVSLISPDDMRLPMREGIDGLQALVSPQEKWPNNVVAWQLDPNNNYTEDEKKIIFAGIEHVANNTCIIFVERTDEEAYINIKGDEHNCWAQAGYSGFKRNLNVPSYCLYQVSTVIHELLHNLGFHHEQTRYDRDLYLEVQWQNIMPNHVHNFKKLPRTYAYPLYPYDFFSIMQYELRGFGIERRPTLALTPEHIHIDDKEIGWAKGMSLSDIYRVRSAYKCTFFGNDGPKFPNARTIKEISEQRVQNINFF